MNKAGQAELDQSIRALARLDTTLSKAIKKFGMPHSRKSPAGFATLARIIVDQQISTTAAASIWARLRSVVGVVNATNIYQSNDRQLKSAGLSAAKVKTLQTLAAAVKDREIVFRALSRKSDEEVKATLTNLWGIGIWTADIYLMFGLGRPDVWPVGDLALRAGWQCVSGREPRISAEDLADKAESWRPHRSAAAILLWHCLRQSKDLK